ncbi:ORF6N domain-containing protein [Yersinia pekkanenii]|uniref:Phage anti-repressor protein n=1 Tax=Yersinia pekkanenii TaxID=1288385 RepID=A0A0T9PR73_9GAMM|nr:Phage anti-repressor protein [Yersinia pekkanenii]CRY69369.1 Phage anti-repressor protein [Yersinia pekkanenii]
MTTLAKTVSTNTQSRAISADSLPSISHNSVPVITTELLANLYGTVPIRIRQSHKRNSDRFICGKHYFKLEGKELADLRVSLSYSQNPVSPKVRALILWTERGAARHAKMLETDQAWEVFEKLEDCYFNAKAGAAKQPKQKKSSSDQRTPLRQYVEKMIANKSGMKYPAIWRLVHDRFDVEHINQLSASESLEAVEFLKVIEGEFLGRKADDSGNPPAIPQHFNCRVLYTFDSNGTIVSAQQAMEDEHLASAKAFAEVMSKRGYALVKMEDFKKISLHH